MIKNEFDTSLELTYALDHPAEEPLKGYTGTLRRRGKPPLWVTGAGTEPYGADDERNVG